MRVRKRTTYTIEDGDNTFPVTFEPIDGSEVIQIKRNTAKIGYLVLDDDGREGYWEDRDGEQWFGYDPHCHNHDPQSREQVSELARASPGRCFWIHKYEHGAVRYYRAGDALTPAVEIQDTQPADPGLIIPDQQWDVSRGVALYIAPDDAPDPAKYCDLAMEEYSNWVNGYIYGVVTEEFTRKNKHADWEKQGNEDACWGHIGHEWATQALADEMRDPKTASPFQIETLRNFAAANGRKWKSALRFCWETGRYKDFNGTDDYPALQRVRNQFGPSWLVRFRFPK